MRKLLFVAPHLSTGGLPQYLVKKVELLKDVFDIYVVEYSDVTGGRLVVQRNRLKSLLKNDLITLGENKTKLLDVIKEISPSAIHMEEIPEMFCDATLAKQIYRKDRPYFIYETCHDSSFEASNKQFFADKMILVSNYQIKLFEPLGVPIEIIDYPIEFSNNKLREQYRDELGLDPNKKHILNVGLFTPRKNQKEFFEYARSLPQYQFHQVGNMADNFRYYWEPLLKDAPSNLKIWDERSDVHKFYESMDLFLFTSRGTVHDKETMPLVLKEAISANIPIALYNLPVYENFFDQFNNIYYLDFDNTDNNIEIIKSILSNTINTFVLEKNVHQFYTSNGEIDFSKFDYTGLGMNEAGLTYGDDHAMYWGTFVYRELDRGGISVNPGDVFVDLGANIGMSSRYAKWKGASKIYSFEPDINCLKFLEKNVPNSNCFRYAVGKDTGIIELYHWPYNPQRTGPKYTTNVITLKQIFDIVNTSVDYLKIDIEGFEVDLFDNLTENDLINVNKLFIEYHRPDSFEQFCDKLSKLGFNITKEYGQGQNYIYGVNRNFNSGKGKVKHNRSNIEYKFKSNWNWSEQKMTYSSYSNISHPIIISIREYKTDAVLWSVEYEQLPANINFWIVPIPKNLINYETSDHISGVKICIYKQNGQQIYENVFFKEFKPLPNITSLSNTEPYFINFVEYFVDDIYKSFFENKWYNNVVDVGASIGVFTSYVFHKQLSNKVIAVECNPIALRDLHKNFSINPNVKIIDKALSSNNDPVYLQTFNSNSLIATTILDPIDNTIDYPDKKERIKCDAITITDLIDNLGYIDLLKIDIEGAEYDIFENLDNSLFDKINNIFLECHVLNQTHPKRCKKLLDYLNGVGYEVNTLLLDENKLFEGSYGSTCIYASKK
jgi:FkbM family methyltransferase